MRSALKPGGPLANPALEAGEQEATMALSREPLESLRTLDNGRRSPRKLLGPWSLG
jgi:hypothetical protein